MSTTRKIAWNSIVQIMGKIVSTALGLLALGLMTHYLGAEKFGWFTTANSFLQFAGIIIDFGLIPVTAQMLSEASSSENKERIFQNAFTFRLITAVIFFSITPLVGSFLPYPAPVKAAMWLLAIVSLCVALSQIFIGLYQTTLQMHIAAIADIFRYAILVIGIWIAMRLNWPFLAIISLFIISTGFSLAVLWSYSRTIFPLRLAFHTPTWRLLIAKMWPVALSIIFNVIYLRGDILLLSLFKSQSEVGLYGAAYRVIDILTQVAMLVMGVILPVLAAAWAKNDRERFRHYYELAFRGIMIFALPLTVAIATLSTKIMALFGNDFTKANLALALLSLAIIGVYLGAIFGHAAVAINRQKQTMWIFIVNAAITLTGYLIFIPKYGLTGAAFMSVFSEFFTGILLWLTISHFTQIKLSLYPVLKALLSAAIMGGVLYLLNDYSLLILVPLGVIVYAGMILLTKTVTKQMLTELFVPERRM